jgi:UDP-N-acetylglucosamine 2-epimerase (non-hydrolysing)/GDP/UDP-N,N'-diacetylbacillosamine 2-epimerase (hydrolysing)
MKRKICVLTGSRAEYGILRTVMYSIKEHSDLELSILVTGMHLLPKFGYTIKEIKKEGFNIDAKVDMILDKDTRNSMAKSLGRGIIGITEALQKINPSFLVVLGDRSESLAGTLVAAYTGIPVAHISGGDITSRLIDGPIRHAITKFAHIHFPSTKRSGWRIKMMGEEKWRIYTVGSPAIDYIVNNQGTSKRELIKKYSLDLNKKLTLMIQHPTLEDYLAPSQIESTLKVLKELDLQTIVIFPNADAGGRRMINVLDKFKCLDNIKLYESLPHEDYIGLLWLSNVMVGNSSSGIVEAASTGLPVVNIGPRQAGRERAKNVIDVDYNREEIKRAIKKALYNKNFISIVKKKETPYGDGKTGKRIADILAGININEKLLEKKITY